MAQMSVEAFVEVALSELLRRQGMSGADVEKEMNGLRGFNFRRGETRDLWTQLTGDRIQQAVPWARMPTASSLVTTSSTAPSARRRTTRRRQWSAVQT
jgi:hypothetical protein